MRSTVRICSPRSCARALRAVAFGSLLAAAMPHSPAVAKTEAPPCSGLRAPFGPEGRASRTNALTLLGSVTQLLAPLGRPVLDSNLARTLAINANATPAQQAQALRDAFITNENANGMADGLGATLGQAYRTVAFTKSDDDGATLRCAQVAPSVGALIMAVNAVSRSDATAGKSAYATPDAGFFSLPQDGVFDVIGTAYKRPAGKDQDAPAGNARPFLVAPVVTYPGKDFFEVDTHSRLMLWGPSAADKAAGRTGSLLLKSPSFPSGHTTYGYSEALTLALLVPERFAALAYRGSEYGDSRIVIGAHHAIDVIGGRTLATYDLAQDLAGTMGYASVAGTPFRAAVAAAAHDMRSFLRATCPSIATCASADPIERADDAHAFTSGAWHQASPREAYAFRLTYALAPIGRTDLPPEPVPPEAATLLETRFPYLSNAQRLEILRSTEGKSGFFLDASPIDGVSLAARGTGAEAQAGVYSRLDLFAAAQGYRTFEDIVVVDQDAGKLTDPLLREFADFAHSDSWANDIDGRGGVTKNGPGTLTLAGHDTFTGPSRVEGGTLRITGSVVAPISVAEGATLALEAKAGDVALARGATLAASAQASAKALTIAQGARLVVHPSGPLAPGSKTIVVSTDRIEGRFADVRIEPPLPGAQIVYTPTGIYLTIDQKRAAVDPPH